MPTLQHLFVVCLFLAKGKLAEHCLHQFPKGEVKKVEFYCSTLHSLCGVKIYHMYNIQQNQLKLMENPCVNHWIFAFIAADPILKYWIVSYLKL